MMDVFRKGYVYVRNVFAGILAETDSGYSFTYDEDYLEDEKTLEAIAKEATNKGFTVF